MIRQSITFIVYDRRKRSFVLKNWLRVVRINHLRGKQDQNKVKINN